MYPNRQRVYIQGLECVHIPMYIHRRLSIPYRPPIAIGSIACMHMNPVFGYLMRNACMKGSNWNHIFFLVKTARDISVFVAASLTIEIGASRTYVVNFGFFRTNRFFGVYMLKKKKKKSTYDLLHRSTTHEMLTS